MELEGLVPNNINIAVSICYIDAIFLCNELVTVFPASCSEGSLTHVSEFVLTANLILFPDIHKYRGSFSILLTTEVKFINCQAFAYFIHLLIRGANVSMSRWGRPSRRASLCHAFMAFFISLMIATAFSCESIYSDDDSKRTFKSDSLDDRLIRRL